MMTTEQELEAQAARVLEPLDAMIAQVNALIAASAPPQGRRAIRDARSAALARIGADT